MNEKLLKENHSYRREGTPVLQKQRLVVLLFLALCTLFLPASLAFTQTSPTSGATIFTAQPLLAWNAVSGAERYEVTIAPSQDLHDPILTASIINTYYQIQTPLDQGTWYWQVKALKNTTNETTAVSNFIVGEEPAYTVTYDTSAYETNKRVDFTINAPLGSAVDINISTQGFLLPFSTTSLDNEDFSTFLDPGDYTLDASFNYQGTIKTYATTFTLDESATTQDESTTYNIGFNVTDDNDDPIKNVKVTLTSDNDDYTDYTDKNGWVNFTVTKNTYDITLTHDDYDKETSTKSITKDRNYSFTLQKKASLITTSVIITSPTYKQELTTDSYTIAFSATNPAYIDTCDALFRAPGQTGWVIIGQTSRINDKNTLDVDYHSPTGEASIKVRCSIDGRNYESSIRTVIIGGEPEHNQDLQSLIDEISTKQAALVQLQEPLFETLNIATGLADAKKRLIALDDQYYDLTGKGDKAGLAALDQQIATAINDVKANTIAGFKITQRSEAAINPDPEAVKAIIQDYVQEQGYEGKQATKAAEQLIADQGDFAFRLKVVTAEITKLDGSTTYLTGLTRTVQDYSQTKESYNVIEDLPGQFLQQSGTPQVLGENGQKIATIENDRLQLTLADDGTYTYLFQGKLTIDPEKLDVIAIIKTIDDSAMDTKTGLAGITGNIISAEGGGKLATPIAGLIVALIIAVLIVKPPLPGTRKDNLKVRQVTDDIHDVLDFLEQGRHSDAFIKIAGVIENYEQLKPKHQQSLRFAMDNLSTEMHLHLLSNTILENQAALSSVTSSEELAGISSRQRAIITGYKQLQATDQERLKPILQSYISNLKQKQQALRQESTKKTP